jgi:aspartyl-tRNA(Asn)/glutamyl-tRNA(Gln) amidotransferase subunit B
VTTAAEVDQVRATLGELPADLRARLENGYQIPAYDADVLVNQGREVVDYFLAAASASGDGKATANWVTQHVLRVLNDEQSTIDRFGVSAERLAALIVAVRDGALPGPRSREAFELMLAQGVDVDAAIAALGIEKVDESQLVDLCRELLAANPRIVADVQAGKLQALGALIGQAKKKNPNVDPARVREICLELVQSGDVA